MTRFPSFRRSAGQKEATIPDLVHTKSWGTLRKVLSSPGCLQQKLELSEPTDLLTIIHKACCLHPPLDVIKLLCEQFPESNSHPDNMGRYPIHLATEWGAAPKVIEYLVDKDPLYASFQDKNGKTPLHYFCQYYAENCSSKELRMLRDCMIDIIKILARAAPLSLIVEDFEELNAVEYAIQSGMESKVVRKLQKECENYYKQKHKNGVKHEEVWNELRKDLETHKDISKRHLLAANEAMITRFSERSPPRKQETDQQPDFPRRAVAA